MQKDMQSNTISLFKNAETKFDVTNVRPLSTKEICALYNISTKTFFKWSAFFQNEIGPRRGRYYTVNQVEIIFLKLGLPYSVVE